MMNDAGIQLGSATVGTSLPNQQQSNPGEQSRSPQHTGGRFDAGEAEPAARVVKTTAIQQNLGLVDTFA
jgi:flagellar hook-length control protein FliK